MDVNNRGNSKSTGSLTILKSWMLIGPQNSSTQGLSLQISEIPVGSAQPLHSHEPEQCYYIVRGRGIMTIGEETRQVSAGDAVYIPPNRSHGIENSGDDVLEYVTANSPVFDSRYENALWPADPAQDG